MEKLAVFNATQIKTIKTSTRIAEEMVSNHYKLSSGLWLKRKYDILTLEDLLPDEIVHGPFAQIVYYKGQPKDSTLESKSYDFYKICLQDHAILSATSRFPEIQLFPFSLYIIIHELIHVVRFSKFLQNFHASDEEKMAEEKRVHENTVHVLKNAKFDGLPEVFNFYHQWIIPFDDVKLN
jgi:hypothetical protein